jgi:hypothetical protein
VTYQTFKQQRGILYASVEIFVIVIGSVKADKNNFELLQLRLTDLDHLAK